MRSAWVAGILFMFCIVGWGVLSSMTVRIKYSLGRLRSSWVWWWDGGISWFLFKKWTNGRVEVFEVDRKEIVSGKEMVLKHQAGLIACQKSETV